MSTGSRIKTCAINIVVKEKFPWAPLPTFSYSPGNISGGRSSPTETSLAKAARSDRRAHLQRGFRRLAAYEDPAVWGSWIFSLSRGSTTADHSEYSNEYGNLSGLPLSPMRNTKLRSYGGDINVGVAWFRKVRTSVGWIFDQNDVLWSAGNLTTVLPRFSTCRQARPADGGAPPRPM